MYHRDIDFPGHTNASRPHCVAIIQSSYLPWRGYFAIMRAVDTFVLLDDTQFTRRDWRNRNRIRSGGEPFWLTVPVESKNRYTAKIEDMTVASPDWGTRHLSSIHEAYAGTPGHDDLCETLAPLLSEGISNRLSEVNAVLLAAVAQLLHVSPRVVWSSEYPSDGVRGDRILDLCLAIGATHYLSGPSAASYLDLEAFSAAGIAVEFADYALPTYEQRKRGRMLAPEPRLSIIDTIANLGIKATIDYLATHLVVDKSRWPR